MRFEDEFCVRRCLLIRAFDDGLKRWYFRGVVEENLQRKRCEFGKDSLNSGCVKRKGLLRQHLKAAPPQLLPFHCQSS